MYGTTKLLKDFGPDKDGAIEWAKQYAKSTNLKSWDVIVMEYEYTSEKNLQRDFSLYAFPVWSASFAGYKK
jgi:hypothetical protein